MGAIFGAGEKLWVFLSNHEVFKETFVQLLRNLNHFCDVRMAQEMPKKNQKL